jgi:hypothetical protein
MFVELLRPLADHQPGDLLEVDRAAARALAQRGYTKNLPASPSLIGFLRAVQLQDVARLREVYGSVEAKASLGTETGAAKGFLIPTELLPEILFPTQQSLFRSRPSSRR